MRNNKKQLEDFKKELLKNHQDTTKVSIKLAVDYFSNMITQMCDDSYERGYQDALKTK